MWVFHSETAGRSFSTRRLTHSRVVMLVLELGGLSHWLPFAEIVAV